MSKAIMASVFGMRGMGKTTKTVDLAKDHDRVLVFDPMCEYMQHGYRQVAWSEIGNLLATGEPCRLSFTPHRDHCVEALSTLARILLDIQDGPARGKPLCLVVEEMSLSYPEEKLPREHRGMKAICEQGRHSGITTIGTTQRPATISTVFRGNCEAVYVFPLFHAGDVDAVVKIFGSEYRDQLKELQPHNYLVKVPGSVSPGCNPPLGAKKT